MEPSGEFIFQERRENRVDKNIEFAVFCIESVAQRLHADAADVYAALADRSDILHSYILPCYEVLHSQGKDYIVDDILDVMKEKGVRV